MENLRIGFKPNTFLLLAFFEMLSVFMIANPGDTTWVTVYNQRKLTQYGTYDTVAVFPTSLRYRKIRLHYILGRYSCPAGSQYCGSWDYTTQIYARPAGKDSVEIARVITPYATDWLSATVNKSHDYIVEVTDYASALNDTTAIRFNYEGYSWGFTITLKLEMIEGVPPMDALSVKNIYDGYYTYGYAPTYSANIENYLVPKTFSYTAPTTKAFVKNTVSGHGSDNLGCSEFCSKYYQLLIDNNFASQVQLWRTDCGLNEVYPQTGTWLFQRANWCPGAIVWPIYHDLSTLTTPNTTFSVNVDMEPYVINNPSAGYNFVSQMINYSAANYNTDVSIEDVVAPTVDDNYLRENPTCTNPVIKIKNTGSLAVTSVVFSYGLAGSPPATYTWTGNLNFLDVTQITINPLTPIFTNTVATGFDVSIISVNGAPDQNSYNNIYHSVAAPTTVYPPSFVVRMFTNNSTDANTGSNETSWTLYDAFDNVVTARTNLSNGTLYLDTLNLSPGCYRFEIDDSGCDGFNWWYYQYYNPNPGTGTVRFDHTNTVGTYTLFSGDIGCSYIKYFTVLAPTNPVGIQSYVSDNNVGIYPNPAGNVAHLKLDLNKNQEVSYKITDVNGRLVQQNSFGKVAAAYEPIDVSGLANGVYVVSVQLEAETVIKKLIIQK